MKILDKVNSSSDIKRLNQDELSQLCDEIRELIISTVSKNGGHLSSNLGAVELTVAINRVFDPSSDRIIFDVGHQCYTHKIINGRKNDFFSLRTTNGISGFPKPCESKSDAFIAGHASTSISAALGMAKARTLLEDDYCVVAVIGDGALTGGTAYEGLINAADSKEPLIIIINDNNMSIDKNVGGVAHLLQKMRTDDKYINFKHWFKSIFKDDNKLYQVAHSLKELIKTRLLPENLFTDLGFEYLGPVDGHDISKVERLLKVAKSKKTPVIVHTITQKGKGYVYSEQNPDIYHSVGPFDVDNVLSRTAVVNSFSSAFGHSLYDLGKDNNRVVAVTAAMAQSTGLELFASAFQGRFFDVGIAEEHAVIYCAGMAKQGIIPVFAVFSTFLQRAYDMLIHDIALQNLHVIFCIDRAGLSGNDGETHNGIFDVSYLSSVPNMSILSPSCYSELRAMLRSAIYDFNGPVAIRYPKGSQGEYDELRCEAETVISKGTDITLIGYGIEINEILKAAEILKQNNISAEVIKIGILKPNDFPLIINSISKTGSFLIAEEVISSCCIGQQILAKLELSGIVVKNTILVNLGDGIIEHGDQKSLLCKYGLDSKSIAERICNVFCN